MMEILDLAAAGTLNYICENPIADDMNDFFDVLALALQLPSLSVGA